MNFSEKANLIIYRIREKGLEVFLVNEDEQNAEQWGIPQGKLNDPQPMDCVDCDAMFELDAIQKVDGEEVQALAVEGDWHDIPSLKGILLEDVNRIKDKMEKGTFFAVKEAVKKVMPHQYAFLKELKDIITDRNSVQNL
ncbi:MAG: hypothetical protein AB8G22_20370 [Saprospiraceae bacterium]